jgi:hypothetical protein
MHVLHDVQARDTPCSRPIPYANRHSAQSSVRKSTHGVEEALNATSSWVPKSNLSLPLQASRETPQTFKTCRPLETHQAIVLMQHAPKDTRTRSERVFGGILDTPTVNNINVKLTSRKGLIYCYRRAACRIGPHLTLRPIRSMARIIWRKQAGSSLMPAEVMANAIRPGGRLRFIAVPYYSLKGRLPLSQPGAPMGAGAMPERAFQFGADAPESPLRACLHIRPWICSISGRIDRA